ncbi:MAG TPA: hypothetical protein VGI46_20110 [Candidatus Acidoferrum sp.]|jgi:hypothetical protein
MTQLVRMAWFAVFSILFLASTAFGQQSQSWKFPLSIPTTQSGYPSPVVASNRQQVFSYSHPAWGNNKRPTAQEQRSSSSSLSQDKTAQAVKAR